MRSPGDGAKALWNAIRDGLRYRRHRNVIAYLVILDFGLTLAHADRHYGVAAQLVLCVLFGVSGIRLMEWAGNGIAPGGGTCSVWRNDTPGIIGYGATAEEAHIDLVRKLRWFDPDKHKHEREEQDDSDRVP